MLIHVSSDDVVLKYVSGSNLLLLVYTEVWNALYTISEDKIVIFALSFLFLLRSIKFMLELDGVHACGYVNLIFSNLVCSFSNYIWNVTGTRSCKEGIPL